MPPATLSHASPWVAGRCPARPARVGRPGWRSDHRSGRRSDIAFVIGTPAFPHPGATGPDDDRLDGAVELAFVNNMPDPAFAETERQFLRLLAAASGGQAVVVHRYWMPGIARGDAVRRRVRASYRPLERLFATAPAGCIVTGTEPRAEQLADEPYWSDLVAVLEWGADHGVAMWLSCLAAHAALLAYDGIERVPLPAKFSGVFAHAVDTSHPLTRGLGGDRGKGTGPAAPVMVPHSRLNTVPDDALRSRGYELPMTSPDVGWTLATKVVGAGAFVLVQGHPEYSTTSLLREYRRDVRRYLRGDRPDYPAVPTGYLDQRGTQAAAAFAATATATARAPGVVVSSTGMAAGSVGPALAATGSPTGRSRSGLLPGFPYERMARGITNTWQAAGVRLLANWLSELRRGGEASGA